MIVENNPGSSSNRLALLVRLTQDLNTTLDPDKVLERAMDEVINITGAERGFVMLCHETEPGNALDEKTLTFQIARGLDAESMNSGEHWVSRNIIRQVIDSRQPILSSDASTDGRFNIHQSVTLHGLRSIMCAPMRMMDRILGVIYVDSRIHAGVFTEPDLEMLKTIAASAAIAYENARLYQDARSGLETLSLLHRISEEITSTLDLERVLTGCVQAVQNLLKASAASILTLEGDELVFQIAVGDKAPQIKPIRIPKDKGVAGWVLQNKQPVISNHVREDPRFFNGADSQTGFATQSLAAAPLIVNERAIGVIEVFNKPDGFSQADLSLLSTFASSAAFAIDNARLYQLAVEKGRMERELQMARKVQTSLLPDQTPRLAGWEFASRWLPARQVSGDFYDFVPLEIAHGAPFHLGVLIADVTDKGMPAALFMAMARSTLRASLYSASNPVEGILHANTLISADSLSSMFVSIFYAQINPANGEVTFVNGGHPPPLLYHPSAGAETSAITRLIPTGLPLGIDRETSFTQITFTMNPGDLILLYTDGVTDAMNPAEETFKMERLEALLAAHGNQSPEELIASLEQALHLHMAGSDPIDDITILAIKRCSL